MLDKINQKQKRILAIARNTGQLTLSKVYKIYTQTAPAKHFLQNLISENILFRTDSEGLFLYNTELDSMVLDLLCNN